LSILRNEHLFCRTWENVSFIIFFILIDSWSKNVGDEFLSFDFSILHIQGKYQYSSCWENLKKITEFTLHAIPEGRHWIAFPKIHIKVINFWVFLDLVFLIFIHQLKILLSLQNCSASRYKCLKGFERTSISRLFLDLE